MSRSVNKVLLIGNVGKDPEVKYFPNGDAFCNVGVATTEVWNDKTTGEKKERTEWHNVTFTRKLAEIVGQYVRKGSKIYVEGMLRTRKWQDKEGQDRYTTEVMAMDMQMLDGKPDGGAKPATQAQQRPQAAPATGPAGFEDDNIPF